MGIMNRIIIITFCMIFVFVVDIEGQQQLQTNMETTKQPGGSVFTRVGTIYTGLAYGHIILRYNFTSISWRTRKLEEVNVQFQNMIGPKEATGSDRYFLKWSKFWMQHRVKDTIEKIEEAVQVLRNRPKTRQKRQLLVGLAGATIGTIAGSIITEFSANSVHDVVKNKQNVLVATVKDNLVRINQEERDMKNLKKSMEWLLKNSREYILEQKRKTYGIGHLQTIFTIQQTTQSMQDAMNTLEAARLGEFNPSMADHEGLINALKQLRSKAVSKGYEPAAQASMDLKHLPCSTYVDDDLLHLIIHVPLYQSHLDLDLFRYVDHPVKQLAPNLYASMDMDGQPTFLGVNRDESKYKEFSNDDLQLCYHLNRRYFCPDLSLYSKQRPQCLWALYKNHEKQIRAYCKIALTAMAIRAVRVDEVRWMITDTAPNNELAMVCNNEVPERQTINGTEMVTIPKGCQVTTNHITIDHPEYEPDIVIEGLVINDAISFDEWIEPEKQTKFVENAQEMLARVGQKVSWNEINTLTEFNAKMTKAELTTPNWGFSGLTGWLTHALAPVITVIFAMMTCYVMIKLAIPICHRLRRQHREQRAKKNLDNKLNNHEIAMHYRNENCYTDEPEPMDVDEENVL